MRLISAWRAGDGSGRTVTLARTTTGVHTVLATLPAGPRLPSLTGDAATLDHRLGLGRGVSTETALTTLAAAAAAQPIPPAAESEILGLLAGDAGLADAGTTRDRAGRSGVAITYTAPALGTTVHDTLVFDPADGALLEFDQALAGDPHSLNVNDGALLSFTVYLRSGRVAAIGQRPR